MEDVLNILQMMSAEAKVRKAKVGTKRGRRGS